jgi:circadian clock protein KaiB
MIPESPPRTARAHFERAIAALETEPYTLTLFVSGASDSSAQAIANVRDICDGYLMGRYQLDIVDLNQEPALAGEHHVLATPTLVKDHPLPTRMLVGDMSDHPRILIALDVRVASTPNPQVIAPDTSSGQ